MNRILGTQILWLADNTPAFWAIVIADVWKTAPFIGLLTLAGLQTIPAEVYEAFSRRAGEEFGFAGGAKTKLFLAMWEAYAKR